MPATADTLRYSALKRSVLSIGFIRRGSLVRRFMPCGQPGCRCRSKPPRLHGPYYQWTRKIRGKTVTVRVTFAEAKQIREWIKNGRQLNGILSRMEKLSLRITARALGATER